jgi:hypothetical protein
MFLVDILNIELYHKPITRYNVMQMGVYMFFMFLVDILNITLYNKPVTSYNVM